MSADEDVLCADDRHRTRRVGLSGSELADPELGAVGGVQHNHKAVSVASLKLAAQALPRERADRVPADRDATGGVNYHGAHVVVAIAAELRRDQVIQ